MKKVLGAGLMALTMGVAPAYATTFTQLDQASLDTLGTSDFGAIIDSAGGFEHTFDFTTAEPMAASSAVITILLGGGWDVDFTSVSLDGMAFDQQTGDPTESWALTSGMIGAGAHTLRLTGTVRASPQSQSGSYGGTLNLAAGAIPEPAAWAMMIVGFGGVGALMRRKRAVAAHAG